MHVRWHRPSTLSIATGFMARGSVKLGTKSAAMPRDLPLVGPKMHLFEPWQCDHVWRLCLVLFSASSACIVSKTRLRGCSVYLAFSRDSDECLVPSLTVRCLIVDSWVCLISGVRLTYNASCTNVMTRDSSCCLKARASRTEEFPRDLSATGRHALFIIPMGLGGRHVNCMTTYISRYRSDSSQPNGPPCSF